MTSSKQFARVPWSRGLTVCLLVMGTIAAAEETSEKRYVQGKSGERVMPVVAVDNVCAWPNLTLLPDGTIVATIHNQPSHLKVPADVDCWASEGSGTNSFWVIKSPGT